MVAAAYPGLLRYARLLTGDRTSAEDVVHEALVRCLRRSRQAEIRDFVSYVRRAIVNEVIRAARRRGRQPTPDPAGVVYPQDAVIEHENLREWLAGLPSRQRVAVVSRYFLDMTEQDTAELMGCSLSSVKSLCRRGLAQLRGAATAETVAQVRVPPPRWAGAGSEDR